MFDYRALQALAEIIRRGSFDAAAANLGVTPSAISQRIRSLEDRMGEVLVQRGPPARGTAAGLRLMQHFDQVRLLEQAFHPAAPAVLRIAVNADSLATWFPAAMTSLAVRFDLIIDDQDHARDLLRKGEVAAALSSQSDTVAGCDAIMLGHMRYFAMASSDFCAQHFPDGPTAAALACAPAIIFNSKDTLQSRWAKSQTGAPIDISGHMIPASEPFARAIALGLGWGMIPEIMAPHLPPLLSLAPQNPLDVPLFWHVPRALKQALGPLTQAIKERAAALLRP